MFFLFHWTFTGRFWAVQATAILCFDFSMILTVLITHIDRILKSPIFFRFLAIVRFTDLEPECVLFFLSACITSNCLFDIISQKSRKLSCILISQTLTLFNHSLFYTFLFSYYFVWVVPLSWGLKIPLPIIMFTPPAIIHSHQYICITTNTELKITKKKC